MAEKQQSGEHVVEDVEVALVKTGDFFEKHKGLIIGVVIAIIVLVGGYFGYRYLIVAPKEKTAAAELFYSQRYFEMDSLNTALNGDGLHPGLLEIAQTYKSTPSGKLAHYYAGIAYLHQGRFQDAIDHLGKFRTTDPLLHVLSCQALGDAYLELEQTSKALAAYEKGAGKYQNDILTPGILMRVAITHEMMQQYDKALDTYIEIRDNYPASQQARDIERQIARLKAKTGK